MSPANIEAKLKAASTLIAQAVAIGDNRPYNVALIVLDAETLAARGAAADDPAIAEEIDQAVEAANARLSRVEQIKRYEVLDGEWVPGGEELTPTMKLKRRPIERKYEARDRSSVRRRLSGCPIGSRDRRPAHNCRDRHLRRDRRLRPSSAGRRARPTPRGAR